ncbi:MAG: hypothetical protein GW779_03435 [Candidatus Altiarchaeum hamiconexum]|uniref:Periplasmic copper-binding protein NosD beta helix domain-containing protein n=1 Tax=Candidatus Altarchaeum hamiconexum TaxID=1803513 RepID=A0A8J7YVG4_9ARCH|nr:hypothetical protein [Candidatus Altarchaeum hamiconexum]OIQ05851.1 MAG: hypothetical protein AUK59_02225 [Candidatus Altarchaeum sp. CG2_30_32_3053]PIN68124.1 MAG: hypothetical protein COV98_00400 [Candidatus Altarchaeum sp. CG12_big_fil_rev_8_21_14_0_65_33_22]PIV27467.1 MAG: hypothetical protein COS36_05605 [Candidatus Altarchaeum sp. CG03_land_8_20_14_0_80_32_618]PIX48575.1 MAG: hypothetical protein COZ53_03605 [Candidatus Altarchaeum sp. CG_4_8_14_3_um_filter_33_2054]PIZ31571.1 MAG: hyp
MKTKNKVMTTKRGNENFGNGNVLNFVLAGLFAVVLVFLARGNVFAYSNLGGGVCECDSCSDCTNALNDNANCSCTAKLNKSITDIQGTCIDDPENFTNKTFDCQGNVIKGYPYYFANYAIHTRDKQNNTIKNCVITQFYGGIYLYSFSNNTLTNNTTNNNVSYGIYGIYLYSFSNNTITSNTTNNNGGNYGGISLEHSSNNALVNNTANSNNWMGINLESDSSNNTLTNNTANSNIFGIYLEQSINNILRNNTFANNRFNFNIYESEISHYYQDIDKSNIVNNKPIYYLKDCAKSEINESSDDEFVALISCDNITLKNLNLTRNSHGILLVHTTNSRILNNTVNSNYEGRIYLYLCVNNTMSNNIANLNIFGISLDSSSNNNTLTNNTANSNMGSGRIMLRHSSNNTLTNNTADNNRHDGIHFLWGSNFNEILNNKISNNKNGITLSNCDHPGIGCFERNTNNTIQGNEILNNTVGIFSNASNSTINSNYVCGNTQLDFDLGDWLSSVGDNNYCGNAGGWNDANTIGCQNTGKATSIFDLVEMLEYLNREKNLSYLSYCDLDNDNNVNLPDAFALIDKIVREG